MDRAIGCASLWNKLNYRRRQSFFSGDINWEFKDLYNEFKGWVGSATAQQIIKKNASAWKAFFSLLKKKTNSGLPPSITKLCPPGYWKDRDSGELKLIYIVKNQNYRIKGRNIYFPFKLKGRIKGKPKWQGEQGELELIYNGKDWIAHQSIETAPLSQPSGQARAYIDIGVRCPIAAVIEGRETPIVYSGNEMLSDWWYWTKRIAKHQGILKTTNDKHMSRRLARLYNMRRSRHRDSVSKLIHHLVRECLEHGVEEIIAGDLTGIRDNGSRGRKVNSMINNFWSHKHITNRLKCTAENFGMTLILKDERGTSSICPRCGSTDIIKRGRLFKCRGCHLEAHRDVIGCTNMSIAHGNSHVGCVNWRMASPEVVRSSHSNNLERVPSSLGEGGCQSEIR